MNSRASTIRSGHPAGDELLKAVASRLQGCVRATDFVARLGGDEFAIVQTGIEQPCDVVELVKRIYAAIREPYDCLGHQIATGRQHRYCAGPE